MSIKKDQKEMVIKNPDGSIMTVKLDNISDPDLKKEVEALKKSSGLILNGKLVKKI